MRTTTSAATFPGSIGDAAVVYKPKAGEQPLWDLPDGCLAHREMVAQVSEGLDCNVLPRASPFGGVMVQLWQGTVPEQTVADEVPEAG